MYTSAEGAGEGEYNSEIRDQDEIPFGLPKNSTADFDNRRGICENQPSALWRLRTRCAHVRAGSTLGADKPLSPNGVYDTLLKPVAARLYLAKGLIGALARILLVARGECEAP